MGVLAGAGVGVAVGGTTRPSGTLFPLRAKSQTPSPTKIIIRKKANTVFVIQYRLLQRPWFFNPEEIRVDNAFEAHPAYTMVPGLNFATRIGIRHRECRHRSYPAVAVTLA